MANWIHFVKYIVDFIITEVWLYDYYFNDDYLKLIFEILVSLENVTYVIDRHKILNFNYPV